MRTAGTKYSNRCGPYLLETAALDGVPAAYKRAPCLVFSTRVTRALPLHRHGYT
jgi:hypothetical protein